MLAVLLLFFSSGLVTAQIETNAATYDLTLMDCLAQTFVRNPDIQRLRADVERAGGDKIVIRSRAWPQFAMQINGGLRGSTLYNTEDIKTNASNVVVTNTASAGPELFAILTAQFSQPLIDIAVPPSWRRGGLEVVIAQQNLNREITDRLHEVRVTFLRALYYRDLTQLYDQINQRLQANVESAQERIDTGMGSDAALKWAKIQQLNLARDLSNARAEFFNATTQLATLCGREPTIRDGDLKIILPRPVGELEFVPLKLDPAQQTQYALEHRADLKLLQVLIDATSADKHVVQAGYFPLVSLVSSGLLIPQNALVSRQTSIVPGQDPRTSEVRAGVAMSWRMIDNGQVIGASRRVEAARQQYVISLRSLEQNVPRELASIAISLQDAEARRDALVTAAEAAEENLKIIEAQVRLGQATQYDFLKAQSDLLSVRAGILDATYTHEVARAGLDRATGRYLEYRTEPAQTTTAITP